MAITIIGAGIFSILFLLTLGLISNVSGASLLDMQNQMFLLGCPLPLQNQLINATTINIVNNHVVFQLLASNSQVTNKTGTGTFVGCSIDNINGVNQGTFSTLPVNYGATGFANFPSGFILYIGDTMGSVFQKLQAMFTIIFNFISPTGFNIAGFTISNLSTFGQVVVVAIYGSCYTCIGIMIYKAVSPFSGVS